MILDLNLAFPVCWGIQDLLWWEKWVTLVSNAYVLMLPPTVWLCLALPALAMSDRSLSFLWSWLCQNSSESSCLCDPVILGFCDPEILGVMELLGVKLPLGPWDPGVAKLLGFCDPLILGVKLPLGVVGLAVEFVPKVCSDYFFKCFSVIWDFSVKNFLVRSVPYF